MFIETIDRPRLVVCQILNALINDYSLSGTWGEMSDNVFMVLGDDMWYKTGGLDLQLGLE